MNVGTQKGKHVSSENQDVFFDDLKITHACPSEMKWRRESGATSFKVTQVNSYYPFGMRLANSLEADAETATDRFYNGQDEREELTGLDETFFRLYDPATGRFLGVDPMAGLYASQSPYHYAGNNPIRFSDPLGDRPVMSGSMGDWHQYTMPDGSIDFVQAGGHNTGLNWGGVDSDLFDLFHGFGFTREDMGMMGPWGPTGGIYRKQNGDLVVNMDAVSDGASWSPGGGYTEPLLGPVRTKTYRWNPVGGKPSTYKKYLKNGNTPLDNLDGVSFYMGAWEFAGFSIEGLGQGGYQDQIDQMLTIPELAEFSSMAPNTQFEVAEGFFNPKTRAANGDPTVKGPAIVKLPSYAFSNKHMLYVILGHELIHAGHFESGSYAGWTSQYGLDPNGVPYARHITEVMAYQWSLPMAEKYGLEELVGGAATYQYHLSMLPAGFVIPK